MLMLKIKQNKLFISAVSIVATLSATFGVIIGLTYPNWANNLAFLPDFLKPKSTSEEVAKEREKVVRTVEESAVIDAVEKSSPAVVSIVAAKVSLDPSTGVVQDQQGIGTGFIIRSNGVILTASHVVEDRTINYKVVTRDDKTYDVKQIDLDPSIDFAVLKITASGLPTINLGDSQALKVGQKVVAIGNALGRFENTVTVGVVSGIGRGVDPSSSAGILQGTLENVIQTDAALNPGNSGGPLLDLSGQVVGINFATTVGAENIGFVIPINSVKPVLDGYLALGRIIRPFLGISYAVVDQTFSALQNIPQGALIRAIVAGSPAQKAGLQAGDIITKFGRVSLKDGTTLASVLSKFKVGETVEIEVSRGGKTIKLKAKLTEAP